MKLFFKNIFFLFILIINLVFSLNVLDLDSNINRENLVNFVPNEYESSVSEEEIVSLLEERYRFKHDNITKRYRIENERKSNTGKI